MGRTSFKVDSHLIRDLRQKRHLTQTEVAEQIGIHLTRYQNIEWKGSTSPKTAQKLADLFEISIDALQQGIEVPDSRDYQQEIEQTIRNVLEKGENPALQEALQKTFDNTTFSSGSTDENRESTIQYLAEDIAQRIEAVQLVRNKIEIAALSELTGLSEEELLRPANAEGTWFVNIHRREQQSEGDNVLTKITQRANWAIGVLKEYVEKYIQNSCSDKSIHLSQDGFWYRIEIFDPSRGRTVRIDLVRCLPDAKGLRWVKPSWRDEYLIRDPLQYWARENFNFVRDFDGSQSPSGDIRQLRFLVTEYNRNGQEFSPNCPTGRMVICANFEWMTDERLTSNRREGNSRRSFQDWLTYALKCTLVPFLSDYPRECWSLSGLKIRLDESRAKDRRRPLLECYQGTKYRIELVEQVEEDKFELVPWREPDRKVLEDSIQKMLDDPNDPAWTTDEPRRAFAPYSCEP